MADRLTPHRGRPENEPQKEKKVKRVPKKMKEESDALNKELKRSWYKHKVRKILKGKKTVGL